MVFDKFARQRCGVYREGSEKDMRVGGVEEEHGGAVDVRREWPAFGMSVERAGLFIAIAH